MTKYVMIEFADPRLRAVDHYDDILDAYMEVSAKLLARHGMSIKPPYSANGRLFLAVTVSDENVDDCYVSRNLGEISRVLLKKPFYKRYKVGSRLLCYYDSDDPNVDGRI